jgi:F-type H+-transporting ATPase subunit delta
MANDRISGYADALLAVASAEDAVDVVSDEMFRFAQAYRGSEDLRSALSNRELPVVARQQAVVDILGNASSTTSALISMVVGTGRAADLPEIADALVEKGAGAKGKTVARVRSAVELSADQRQRLADAIRSSTGKEVDVRVIIDPSVMGGLITEIDDEIIDGSVRHRLTQLRESFR